MATCVLFPNFILNNYTLAMGWVGNATVSPNKNILSISKNAIDTCKNMTTFTNMVTSTHTATYKNTNTSTDRADNHLYIMINDVGSQET